jgi:tetratricopeptide (TPR) repeat protein
MLKSLNVVAWCIALQCALLAQPAPSPNTPQDLADQALAKAKAGETGEALELYEAALKLAPEEFNILRDYAVVLGWAERYPAAIIVIQKVRTIQNDQPVWALQEFARSYLFGDATRDALNTLNELVELGDNSETTLTRRALALRWLGQSEQAQAQYEAVLQSYPDSAAAITGLAYVQADRNKLSASIETLNSVSAAMERRPEILQAKIRILNWMGRHYEAQRLIESLPDDLKNTHGVLEDRIAAQRWGGNPVAAMNDVARLMSLFPSNSTRQLSADMRSEYGESLTPSFRFGKDSDGLTDRTATSDIGIHLNPAHLLLLGYQYRWLEQYQDIRRLVRYNLGWSGTLSRRVAVYTTVSQVDYRQTGISRKTIGDGAVTLTVNDVLRMNVGAGTVAVDAFNAIGKHVSAPFGFAEVGLDFAPTTRIRSRYSRYMFSDDVIRDRLDAEVTRALLTESALRLSVGWRSNVMWHDTITDDFYSPSRFQSHLPLVHTTGRIASGLNYDAEIAGGWQSEHNSPTLHPFQVSGGLRWNASRHVRTVIEAAKTTSSLDRPSTGQRIYSRWVASASLEIRLR